MAIRPGTGEDIPALMALAQKSSTAAHWTEQQYRTAFVEVNPQRLLFVAESDQITGFLVASGVAGEWELENIAVDPGLRRCGIGSSLIERLMSELRAAGPGRIFLEVRASNSAARALYERCGFRVTGRRSGYYHNPVEDAILYEKNVEISALEIG